MGRIHFPSGDELSPEQRVVYDEVISGPRGRLIGPLRAIIHSPDLAARWSRFGEFLRFSTCLPPKLNELAIIVAGRFWNSQLEFKVHSKAALDAGLHAAAVEAIRVAAQPTFADLAEGEVYEFARELVQTGSVTDETHAAVTRRWGERGVVELTAVIGYYTMVCFTLNAHQIPLPDGGDDPLPVSGRGTTVLPACRVSAGAETP
jgi:4-carboxymuconolactone decarboxylase